MVELAIIIAALFGLAVGAVAGREIGREEQAAVDHDELTLLRNTCDALEQTSRIQIVDVVPGSWPDLFNRCDPGCELCDGVGRYQGRPCVCTGVSYQRSAT